MVVLTAPRDQRKAVEACAEKDCMLNTRRLPSRFDHLVLDRLGWFCQSLLRFVVPLAGIEAGSLDQVTGLNTYLSTSTARGRPKIRTGRRHRRRFGGQSHFGGLLVVGYCTGETYCVDTSKVCKAEGNSTASGRRKREVRWLGPGGALIESQLLLPHPAPVSLTVCQTVAYYDLGSRAGTAVEVRRMLLDK